MNQEAILTKMLQRVKLTHIDKIGFSSNNHLKNFLESYAFNLNPKYENELTIYNDYYEIEPKLSKEALKSFNSITQKERKMLSNQWFENLKALNYQNIYNDIIYMEFKQEDFESIVNALNHLELNEVKELLKALSAYAHLIYEDKDTIQTQENTLQAQYAILHINQACWHLHRILILKDKQ
ncbi:hypothetical protein [Campylobacter helveticus]|uniref:hypothetical protein n=1 Tax=Campylobacter helveticus TaxID=28898 RepID=UPI0022EAE269|nr:hypothetical protein [Campylobacter helveticus]